MADNQNQPNLDQQPQDSQLPVGVHQLADASQMHVEGQHIGLHHQDPNNNHQVDSSGHLPNLPPATVAALVGEDIEVEESGGSIDSLGQALEGRFAYFIFEENKYDSLDHPNKIFVPKPAPIAKDLIEVLKEVFGLDATLGLKWKADDGHDMEYLENPPMDDVFIPVDQRGSVIQVRRLAL